MQNKSDQKMNISDMKNASKERIIYYTCPLEAHSHVRQQEEEAGICDDCGMELKPMRLVKN